ncbi:MAG: response regulator transcription factor [Acidimicrobiales bacterium]
MRRALTEAVPAFERATLLPAYVDVMLAIGDVEAAETASRELDTIARDEQSEALAAMAAFAGGAVALARGDAAGALVPLRRAFAAWDAMDALCDASRARALVGLACRSVGDEDAATLEFDAARGAFERLGAAEALTWLDSLTRRASPSRTHGLSGRELEVLRLIAAGRRNRDIAQELVVSEHTVARHVQNILVKLAVSSRTAASAFAYQHDLV